MTSVWVSGALFVVEVIADKDKFMLSLLLVNTADYGIANMTFGHLQSVEHRATTPR